MLRKFIALAAVFAVAVPAVMETDPETIRGLINSVRPDENVQEVVVPVIHVNPDQAKYAKSIELTGRRVRMAMDAEGHFSGEFKLNGRRVEALVDTGATLVAINRSTARRIGLSLTPSDFKYEVNTANGVTKAAAAKIESLQIGRIFVTDVEAVVLEDRALSGALIGMSFLKQLKKFNVENQTLLLEQ